jgi:hypothetical protein
VLDRRLSMTGSRTEPSACVVCRIPNSSKGMTDGLILGGTAVFFVSLLAPTVRGNPIEPGVVSPCHIVSVGHGRRRLDRRGDQCSRKNPIDPRSPTSDLPAQLRTYLKFSGRRIGLPINFNMIPIIRGIGGAIGSQRLRALASWWFKLRGREPGVGIRP